MICSSLEGGSGSNKLGGTGCKVMEGGRFWFWIFAAPGKPFWLWLPSCCWTWFSKSGDEPGSDCASVAFENTKLKATTARSNRSPVIKPSLRGTGRIQLRYSFGICPSDRSKPKRFSIGKAGP